MVHSPERIMAIPRGIESVWSHRMEVLKMDRRRVEILKGFPIRQTDDATASGKRWLRCVHCGCRIVNAADRISVNGRFAHVFNNPSGYVFEIGCFNMAEGCVNEGAFTLEFTWFAGFSWCPAMCGRCRAHLGWFFKSDKGVRFHGLILANLTDDSRGV